jgi:hypothetical protein
MTIADSDLERALASRPKAAPRPDLRGRVLGAVRSELARPLSGRSERRELWKFAAGAAAAMLLGANLAMSAAADTDFGFRPRQISAAEVRKEAARLRQHAPEMTEGEALMQALLLRGGPRLLAGPDATLPPGAQSLPPQPEEK